MIISRKKQLFCHLKQDMNKLGKQQEGLDEKTDYIN